VVPRLWNDTIEAHRRTVHDAILESAAALVAERGLRAVTMSQIAGATGIGRATLYKYFPDVEAILLAWHERQIAEHLRQLAEIRDGADDAGRLEAVLVAYALNAHGPRRHHTGLAGLPHRADQVDQARRQVRDMVRELLVNAAATGLVRTDVASEELAAYCLHALTAAGDLSSEAAVHRLVAVVLAGLRPPECLRPPE
jgi:AcrR family transcriptional regulator